MFSFHNKSLYLREQDHNKEETPLTATTTTTIITTSKKWKKEPTVKKESTEEFSGGAGIRHTDVCPHTEIFSSHFSTVTSCLCVFPSVCPVLIGLFYPPFVYLVCVPIPRRQFVCVQAFQPFSSYSRVDFPHVYSACVGPCLYLCAYSNMQPVSVDTAGQHSHTGLWYWKATTQDVWNSFWTQFSISIHF